MACKIKPCTCTGTKGTEFQDSMYGKGNRVFNEGERDLICTCCGKRIKKDK